MSAKYKSPSFLLPNELNTSANPANDTGINSLYSMDFDSSSSDYIDVGNPSILNFERTDAFTISAWCYFNGTGTMSIFSKLENTAPFRGYSLFQSSTSVLNFYLTNDNSPSNRIAVSANLPSPTTSAWKHIVVSYDGSSNASGVNFYVDGSILSKTILIDTLSSTIITSTSVNIGARAGLSEFFNGKIDEVAIFNRALESTEIAALYGGTSPNIYPSNLMATDLNPIAYYPLGEQAQNTGYLDPSNPGSDMSGSEWQFPNGVLQDYVMDFDGTDNINSEANISSVSSFTASIWINRDDSATQYIYGQWVDGTTASQSWVIQTVGGIVYFNVRNSSLAISSAISTTSLTTGIWYNIIAVWTGSNIKLYINNSLEDTAACSSMNNPSTAVKLAIGSSSNNVSPFNGKISNAVIWNSDQESNRDNIYNNGSPQTTYTVTPQNWWKLNATSVYTPSAPNYTKALEFNGASSTYVDLNNITSLNGVSQASYSFWFKLTSSTPASGSASVMLIGSNARGASCYYYSSNSFYIHNLNTKWIVTTQPSLNNWHHVCCVFNSGVAEAYVDGISVGTVTEPTLTTTASDFGDNFNIGYSSFYSGLNLPGWINNGGQISNLALFNTALTPSQVSTLFNFGTPETNISFSPQAWWKLDDQTAITDSSGNGNTGTNNGAIDATTSVAVVPSWKIPSALPITTTPNYTTALDFDAASGDEINTNYTPPTGASARTISIWFYQDASGNADICGYGTNTVAGLFDIILYGGNVYIHGYGVGQEYGKGAYTVGVWNHYVITYDGTTAKGYVNNVATPENTVTLSTGTTNTFKIGNGYYNIGNFNGKLSNFSVWNSALTSAQVSTLYNAGTPETAISFSPVSWWKLDTGGSIITDSAGSNNGTNSSPGAAQVTSDVLTSQPVNGVSTTLPSTALQQSDLQFDSPYSNYSLSFDGVDDYIDCGDSDMFSFGDGTNDSPFSVSAWCYIDTLSNFTIITKGVYPTTGEWHIRMTGANKMHLVLYDGNAYSACIINETLSTNQWYHFAFTYDGRGGASANSGIIGYLNGSVATLSRVGGGGTYQAMTNTVSPLYIAKNDSNYTDGKIDETAIFNTELTSAQVLEIYNNGRPKDLSTFSGTAPISWWRLGENAYFDNNAITVPNSISGAPNGTGSGTITTMISADAPGTYANGIGDGLAITDRVGDAPLSTSNSQSYNMIPSDISPYVPKYVGLQTSNIYSMNFDSASADYISIGSLINLGTSSTISFWYKTSSNNQGLVPFGGASAPYYYVVQWGSSVNKVYFRVGTTVHEFTGVTEIEDGSWHHYCIVRTGTDAELFIDGNSRDTLTGLPSATDTLIDTIGATSNGTSNLNNSYLDEVGFWNTALNADQVNFDLYQPSLPAGSNKTADIANNPNLPTPVAWYRMGD